MRKIFCLIFVLIIGNLPYSNACINGKILKIGVPVYFDNHFPLPKGNKIESSELLKKYLYRTDTLYKKTQDIEYLYDKGLLLVLLGEYKEAIKIYLETEKMKPNTYITASNIGTAYELAGQDKEALKWIQKSVRLDSNAHYGSEWLHVTILKAKIQGKNFINSNFLIRTDFGKDSVPATNLGTEEVMKLKQQIFYQVNERVTFIPPKDPVVAHLLFDLGNLAFLIKRYEEAMYDYELALQYGNADDLMLKRKAACQREINKIKNDLHVNKGLSIKADTNSIQIQNSMEILWNNSIMISVVATIVLSVLATLLINLIRRKKN